ncbi:Epithelial-stromal interaction protein 1 [Fukomys damarensis]|uniref:Epithelial-stromal interaction protein 1 n=1 Tax=Fukomys damarensis TaxID=885580 RepID=A0A091D9X1_FUKDA|nr:Epithelial-stromal interaction protein 1 [Fukomys damarensis]
MSGTGWSVALHPVDSMLVIVNTKQLPAYTEGLPNKLPEPSRQPHEEERAKIHQSEHKRVNNAFLDQFQGKSQPGGLEWSGGDWNTNTGNSWNHQNNVSKMQKSGNHLILSDLLEEETLHRQREMSMVVFGNRWVQGHLRRANHGDVAVMVNGGGGLEEAGELMWLLLSVKGNRR